MMAGNMVAVVEEEKQKCPEVELTGHVVVTGSDRVVT